LEQVAIPTVDGAELPVAVAQVDSGGWQAGRRSTLLPPTCRSVVEMSYSPRLKYLAASMRTVRSSVEPSLWCTLHHPSGG
jgi:hypothetical protein